MVSTREMVSSSGSTLYPAMEMNPRRSRTGTVAGPSVNDPPIALEDVDSSDNGLDAMAAQSKALQREKETLTRRIEL